MSRAIDHDPFRQRFGPPGIPVPRMHFADAGLEHMMTGRLTTIGAGWFLGRMFYLFGQGLERLHPCVEAWSFLLPAELKRSVVIGFNAYGAILLLDEEGEQGTVAPVWLLDPLTVKCFGHPQLYVYSLLDDWLPNDHLPGFLETDVYMEYVRSTDSLLKDNEILGIRRPLSMGGNMQLDNFTRVDIVDYYAGTGPIYRRTYERVRQ